MVSSALYSVQLNTAHCWCWVIGQDAALTVAISLLNYISTSELLDQPDKLKRG